ncbi:MAG: hypothetical protein CR997_05930 [Acidobacteria bacterium]|nr:MAG: hypothetical protein CR997_05930 [Acidobacteriota bacterium]
MNKKKRKKLHFLQGELDNFLQLVDQITPGPGNIPVLPGLDIFGGTLPLHSRAGGDHIIYLDFNNRYDLEGRIQRAQTANQTELAAELERLKSKAGVMVADISGHKMTDAYIAAMLHQSFLLGVLYEMEMNGCITVKLFESINNRFYRSSKVNKFLTMIYGEIHQNGKFRFISAGHPMPLIFSAEYNCLVDIPPEMLTRFPPIGTMPSKLDPDGSRELPPLSFKDTYKVHEFELMSPGDILMLVSDGFFDHSNETENYEQHRLKGKLQELKHLSAKEIYTALTKDILEFAPQKDDISVVLIKKN